MSADDPLGIRVEGAGGVSTSDDPLGLRAPEPKAKEVRFPEPPSAYERFKGSYVGKQLADIGSAGTAVADIVGGTAGYMLGAAQEGVAQATAGFPSKTPAQDIRKTAEERAQQFSMSTYAPEEREGVGYRGIMSPKGPIGLVAQGLGLPGQGVKAAAEAGVFGSEQMQPSRVAELQAGTDVGTMASSLALPIGIPRTKPGSMAWYNSLRKQATSGQGASGADYARSTYPRPIPEAPQPLSKAIQQPPHPDWSPDVPWTSDTDIRDVTDGGVGKRDTLSPTLEAKGMRGDYFAPEMTEEGYAGSAQPRAPIPDNSVPYRRYAPEDVHQLSEAEDTPGFLRTAEQRIALRFDKIKEMEEANAAGQAKLNLEASSAQGLAEDVTKAIDPIPIPKEVRAKAEDMVSRNPDARFTEYLPAGQVWLLRDHNRLSDPKGDRQFVEKEASVLKNGINEPLEIKYSIVDGKAVLTNGNTRASLAMKHGEPEIPVQVTVVHEPLKGTEATNGVEVGKFDLPKGDAKPSDIGLAGRPPRGNTGPIGRQRGAVDFKGFMRETLDSTRVDQSMRYNKQQVNPDTGRFESMPDFHKRKPGDPMRLPGWAKKQYGMVGVDINQPSRPKLPPTNPKDLLDTVRKLGNVEDRPLKEVTQGLARDSIKDLDGPDHANLLRDLLANVKQFSRNVLGADTLRALAEKTGAEKVVRWVNQTMINIDMFERQATKDILLGVKHARSAWDRLSMRGFEHRVASDGILPALKSIPKGEEKSFLDIWFKGEGKDEAIKFDKPIHQKVYDVIQKQLTQLHEWMNTEREKLGLAPVAKMPNFYPHVREVGDYIVNVYDRATQAHLRYNMFQTMGQAKKAEAALRKQFPDADVRPAVHKQVRGAMGTDLDAILEAARVNADDSAVTKAMDKLIDQVISKRGAGGHLMQRAKENIGGWLGENRAMPEVEKALSLYTNNAVSYVANLKRRGVQKQVNDLRFPAPGETNPQRLMDIAPRLHSYLDQYISQSRGALATLDKLDQAFMEELGKGLQVGETGVMKNIYRLNNIATVGYLSKMPFFVSQFFQPLMAIPRMMKLQNELGGGVAGILGTPVDFIMGYMHSIMPGLDTTGHSRGVVNYAIKRGMIDPTISHMLESSMSYGPISSTFYKVTGAIEREVVRIPALLMIENSLRSVIKDPQQRYEVATAQMYRSMSGTTRSNTPLLYNKMRPIGASAKTMKSYATNYYGQFAEYIHDIAMADGTGEKLKALAPFGAFVGTTALFGGINGVIGMQEADSAITLFNTLTTSNVRTPREWVMTSGMSDSLVQHGASQELARDINDVAAFGLASKIMPGGARDIQAQVGNPPTTSILSIVPYKIPVDIAVGIIPYMVAASEGKLTDAIRMSTYEHLTLNNPHARNAIEAHFQKPGQPVPRPYMNSAGNFYRSEIEYWNNALTGMNTLDEKRADMALQYFRRHEGRLIKDRTEFLNSFVDDMLKGTTRLDDMNWMDPSEKMKRYFMGGGSPESFTQDIKNTIIQRHMTGMQHEQFKGAQGGGLGFAKKSQEIQPYKGMLPQGKPAFDSNDPLGIKTPGPQSKADNIQLAADTSPNLPGVSGKDMPKRDGPKPPNKYQGDGVVRASASFEGHPLNDTTPPDSWAEQNVPRGDERFRGDVIQPPEHWRGYGQDRDVTPRPNTLDKMPEVKQPNNPIPTEPGRKYKRNRKYST